MLRPTLPDLAIAIAITTMLGGPARAQQAPHLDPFGPLPPGLDMPLDGRAFVLADVLRVRAMAGGQAQVVAALRIGTEVDVEQVQTVDGRQWAEVSVADWEGPAPVGGWVAADLLTERAPTLADVAFMYDLSERLDERTRWAERAVALDPWAPVARDLAAAAAAEAELPPLPEPDLDVWLAACDGGRLDVLGRVDAQGRLLPGLAATWQTRGPDIEAAIEASLAQRQAEVEGLARQVWYPLGSTTPVPGSPFPRPFLTSTYSLQGVGPYGPGGVDANDGAPIGVLGPCPAGGFFSTRPLHELDLAFHDARRHGSLGIGQILRWEIRRLERHAPLADEYLQVPYKMYGCGGEGEFIDAGLWAVSRGDDDHAFVVGATADGGDIGGRGFASYGRAQWVELDSDRALGLNHGEDGTSAGVSMVLVDTGEVREVQHVTLSTWGC